MSNTPKIRFTGFDEEWNPHKLSDIGEIITGTTPSTQHPEYYSEDGIPWVTPTDITDNLIYDTPRKLSPLGEKVARVVPAETILVTCIASIGKNTMLANAGSFNQQINALVPNKQEYDPYFLLTESHHWSAKMKREAASGTMQIVNKNEFSSIKTYVPKRPEQESIGNYFESIDNLIALCQQEYEKLTSLKSACLNKMFPKNGSKTPELRFSGFVGNWKQSKFSVIFDILQNNTLSRAELSLEDGVAKNVHYGDVLVKFGEYLNVSQADLPYIVTQQVVDKLKGSLLQNGDIVMADTAEDETVGKCSEISGMQIIPIIAGLHTIPMRPKIKFASGYLGYYMNSDAYHDQLLPLMQGIKVTSVSKGAIQDTIISFPADIAEQAAIGQYFIRLDNLINLHQRKLKKLKQIRQSMLHNMFV